MSASERERACVVRQLAAGLFSQAIEAERLGISLRRMKPLMRLGARTVTPFWYRKNAASREPNLARSLSHVPGKASTQSIPRVYHTLAAEKLLESEGVTVSAETVRRT